MRQSSALPFSALSFAITLSFIHFLGMGLVPDAAARMAPWYSPHVPVTEACVSPAMLEAAWREAVTLAQRLAEKDPIGDDVARQLTRAHADGTLPIATSSGCPELVFDPLTVGLIIGVAVLALTLLVWAAAMIGST